MLNRNLTETATLYSQQRQSLDLVADRLMVAKPHLTSKINHWSKDPNRRKKIRTQML